MSRSKQNLIRRLTASDNARKAEDGRYRFLRDAFLDMRVEMPKDTPNRWLFDACASDEGRCPFRQVVQAMELAAAHGATLDQLRRFVKALDTFAVQTIADHQGDEPMRPISVVLLEEAHIGADADIAQAHALADPESPACLHRVIQTGVRHLVVIDQVIGAANRLLYRARTA